MKELQFLRLPISYRQMLGEWGIDVNMAAIRIQGINS